MMDGIGMKDKIADIISHILEAHSVELVDVEIKNRKGKKLVTIYINKTGGVTVQVCAELSDIIGEIFDAEDLFPYSYVLEVSSPGLDRPLIEKSDFDGLMVRPGVLTNAPASGNYRVLTQPHEWRNGIVSRADVADLIVKHIEFWTSSGERNPS